VPTGARVPTTCATHGRSGPDRVTALVVIGVVAVVIVLVVAASAAARRRPRSDDIASFRRQIDALSPEARRQTAERMKPPNGAKSGDDGANGT
jgi:hypothetical protein